MGITLSVVEDYVSKNNINIGSDYVRSQLLKFIYPETETTDNSDDPTESLRLPIDGRKKLAPLMDGFKRMASINCNSIKESACALIISFTQSPQEIHQIQYNIS